MANSQSLWDRIPRSVVVGFITLLCALASKLEARSSVPLATRAGPIPGTPGTGLPAEFYDLAGFDLQNIFQVASLLPAQPTATFVATNFDYPTGAPSTVIAASTQLGTFLGANATNLSGASTNTLAYSYFRFSGLIAIDALLDLDAGTPGIQSDFRIVVDDGALLNIGGVTLGDANEGPTTSIVEFEFEQSGLYPVQIDYYEEFGDTGLAVSVASPSFAVLSQPRLYAIPEPASTGTLILVSGYLLGRRPQRML